MRFKLLARRIAAARAGPRALARRWPPAAAVEFSCDQPNPSSARLASSASPPCPLFCLFFFRPPAPPSKAVRARPRSGTPRADHREWEAFSAARTSVREEDLAAERYGSSSRTVLKGRPVTAVASCRGKGNGVVVTQPPPPPRPRWPTTSRWEGRIGAGQPDRHRDLPGGCGSRRVSFCQCSRWGKRRNLAVSVGRRTNPLARQRGGGQGLASPPVNACSS